MGTTLGVLVIGQTPRPDHESVFGACLGEGDRLLMDGVLNGLSPDELKAMEPETGEKHLITAQSDGKTIVIPEGEIIARIPAALRRLEEQGANLLVLACTGELPEFKTNVPLLIPNRILLESAAAVAKGERVGVIVPLPSHEKQVAPRWRQAGMLPEMANASPFDANVDFREAVERIGGDVRLIALACMGYSYEMREKVRALSGLPVMSGKSILVKYIKELLGR